MATTATTTTVDQAVRDLVVDLDRANARISVRELRDKVEQAIVDHPDTVQPYTVKDRGKKGAGTITVYGEDRDTPIALVTIKANGEVDALPGDETHRAFGIAAPAPIIEAQEAGDPTDPRETPATVGDVLGRAGIPARSIVAALKEIDDVEQSTVATDDVVERAANCPPGLSGKALAIYIAAGKRLKEQAADATNGRKAKETAARGATKRRETGKPEDVRAAELAVEIASSKGKPLSQRVTVKEAETTRRVLKAIAKKRIAAGDFPNLGKTDPLEIVPALLGFGSEKRLRDYASGVLEALKDDEKTGVRDLKKQIGSHQVWARKAAAAAMGVYLEARS